MNKYKCSECDAICQHEYCKYCGNKESFKLYDQARDLYFKGFLIRRIGLTKNQMLEAMGR